MQATVGKKQFQFNPGWFGLVVALGLLASVSLGAGALAVTDHLPLTGGHASQPSQLKAYSSAGQGEGLVGPRAAYMMAPLTAYYAAGQGEGLVGAHAASALRAHTSPGEGEGIVGGTVTFAQVREPLKAYASVGMGEGWLTLGRPASALKAYYAPGMGEGWLGGN
jgi:hypothetical protein